MSKRKNFFFSEIKNKQVVFENNDNALQILTQLVDIIPEARYNLVIYYLKNGKLKKSQ